MKVFILDDIYDKVSNAGYKARSDINEILVKHISNGEIYRLYGFIIPNIGNKSRLITGIRHRVVKLFDKINFFKKIRFHHFLKKLNNGDAVVIPFPFECEWTFKVSFVYKEIFKLKKIKDFKIIFIIHDLNSLRFPNLLKEDEELSLLRLSDKIIVHNDSMINWLVDRGISRDVMVNLQIFDYLSPKPYSTFDNEVFNSRKVIFAGNLAPWKTGFLYEWHPSYDVEVYGVGADINNFDENIVYKGVFEADQPTIDSQGISFGLIWDGGSTKGMNGVGSYLRYNNPHKVSLYISQGLPVIIWKESALASFIMNNNLGFTIDSLDEIDAIMKTISIEKYREISNNVAIIGENLRKGYFIENAMLTALDE